MADQPITCEVEKCGRADRQMYGCDETSKFYCADHFIEQRCEIEHDESCMTVVWQDQTA